MKNLLIFGIGAAIGALVHKYFFVEEYEIVDDYEEAMEKIEKEREVVAYTNKKRGDVEKELNDDYKGPKKTYASNRSEKEIVHKKVGPKEVIDDGPGKDEEIPYLRENRFQIITEEEYINSDTDMDQEILLYYSDDVLSYNYGDEIVEDELDIVGQECMHLLKGSLKLDKCNNVYVRDNDLAVEYEIKLLNDTYADKIKEDSYE
jgi:hypothetical protein